MCGNGIVNDLVSYLKLRGHNVEYVILFGEMVAAISLSTFGIIFVLGLSCLTIGALVELNWIKQ